MTGKVFAQRVRRALSRAASAASVAMRRAAPRKSGELRASFVRAGHSMTSSAWSDADHAVFVQWGTRHMQGFHFLERGRDVGERVLLEAMSGP